MGAVCRYHWFLILGDLKIKSLPTFSKKLYIFVVTFLVHLVHVDIARIKNIYWDVKSLCHICIIFWQIIKIYIFLSILLNVSYSYLSLSYIVLLPPCLFSIFSTICRYVNIFMLRCLQFIFCCKFRFWFVYFLGMS